MEHIASKFRRFGEPYCFQLQSFWWNLLLPTSDVLVKVLLPTSDILVKRTASNFRRFGGTYCFQLQAFWWNVLLPTSNFFPEDEGRTFLLNSGTLLPDCTAPCVIRRDIYSQRHKNLKHVTCVKVCNSEFCFTSKSIFSIEALYGTSLVLRAL